MSFFDTLFGGGGPSLDVSPYTGMMNDSYGRATQVLQQPMPNLQQIMQLLGPGPNGGLSGTLQPMYEAGARQNQLNTNAASANAQSGAAARNLTGSSIEQSGMNAAQMGGQMANEQLLASLLGQQFGASSQLAGILGQSGMNQQQGLASLFQNQGENQANMGMFGAEQNMASQLAQQNQQSQMFGSLLGLGGALGGSYLMGNALQNMAPGNTGFGMGTMGQGTSLFNYAQPNAFRPNAGGFR